MKTFYVEYSEILTRNEMIEAESLEQALEQAKKDYRREKIVLDARDFSGVSIVVEDPDNGKQLEIEF